MNNTAGVRTLKCDFPKPTVLLILDGFGCRDDGADNAIFLAKTPVWDRLWANCSHTQLDCSGSAVGLPECQMGNSEVGHLHLGAGRLLSQEFTRINDSAITDKFSSNSVLCGAVDKAIETGKALHLMGLLSPGGVHSHEKQIQAMIETAVARGLDKVYLHAFLDGRDTPPQSAEESIREMNQLMGRLGQGRMASIVGRYYAMDRDNRWERVQHAYDLIVRGEAPFQATDAIEGLKMAYERGETDEFVQGTAIVSDEGAAVRVEEGDVFIFMNFRADRARELTRAIAEPGFDAFDVTSRPRVGAFVTLTEYQQDFDYPVAFAPRKPENTIGELFSRLGLKQLRLAETEKYAHVTFFFNGGVEAPFEGETRILVPSPKVKTYDLKPEMSAPEVTDALVNAIAGGEFDAIICNYANCDMVGHTGKLDAAINAVETIDHCVGRVIEALERAGGQMLLTADHGNIEQMEDHDSGQVHTAHTVNHVPFVYFGGNARLADGGTLADVAPTMLDIMGIEKPAEMTGRSLIIED
ncbi:MAG: 2,3-bisphosphoglycerate-independent phosphoglycerate mutase [Pseudomonadota bacterium]